MATAAPGPCVLCDHTGEVLVAFDTGTMSVNCSACGKYSATEDARELLASPKLKDERFRISGITRRSTEARQPRLEITPTNVPELLKSATVPETPFEVADRVVLLVHEYLPTLNGITVFQDVDYPLLFARNIEEFRAFLGFATKLQFITVHRHQNGLQCELTLPGWRHFGELRKVGRVSDQAFVAMWFSDNLFPAFRDGIEPGLNDAGYAAVRVDQEHYNEKIDDRIIAEIRRSGLVVADFTGGRGGVYYEAGFARGLGLPVISTVHKDQVDSLHFDTRQYNHLVWETPAQLRTLLRDRVVASLGLASDRVGGS